MAERTKIVPEGVNKLHKIAEGKAVSPAELIKGLGWYSNYKLKESQHLEPWEVRFGQIMLGEEHESIPDVFGFGLEPELWRKYPNLTSATVALIYKRNQQLGLAVSALKERRSTDSSLDFLLPYAEDRSLAGDFFAKGLYAIKEQGQSEGRKMDLEVYFNGVRGVMDILHRKSTGSIEDACTSVNTLLVHNVFAGVGLVLKKI